MARRQMVAFTRGMANGAMKGRTVVRACEKCGMGLPKYVGRYPTTCSQCKGSIVVVEAATSTGTPTPAWGCTSMVPRIQRILDAGTPAEAPGPHSSRSFVVRYDEMERQLPGGVQALTNFMEGPDQGRFYRVESPDQPVLVLELDAQLERARLFSTNDPARYLGSDPRTEFVDDAPKLHERGGAGGGMARAPSWDHQSTVKPLSHEATSRSVIGKPHKPGEGQTSPYGGFRIHVGGDPKARARNRKPRMDMQRALQNKRNARRGLAKRVRAAKEWHASPDGERLHRAMARYNKQRNKRGPQKRPKTESMEGNMSELHEATPYVSQLLPANPPWWLSQSMDLANRVLGRKGYEVAPGNGYEYLVGQPGDSFREVDTWGGAPYVVVQDSSPAPGTGTEAKISLQQRYKPGRTITLKHPDTLKVTRTIRKLLGEAVMEAKKGHSASAAKLTGEHSQHARGKRKFAKKQASKKRRQQGKKAAQDEAVVATFKLTRIARLQAPQLEHAYARLAALVEAATDPYAETIDDVLDDLLRKLLVTEDLDILQDVEFDETTGSIYLFFDPSLRQEEITQVHTQLSGAYNELALVASPDMSLPEEQAPSDWWVMFLPRNMQEAAPPMADPAIYSSDPDGSYMKQQIVVPAPVNSPAQIAQSIDIDQAMTNIGGGTAEAVDRLAAASPALAERLLAQMERQRDNLMRSRS